MMKNVLSILIGAVLILGAGCGVYTFNPGGKSSIKTIAVTQFENETIEVGLSSRLTDLVVDALIADGSMKVVSAENAESILHATLTSYNRQAYTYDESDNVS
ncbi:MAG: LPS assembly lipoprotein LptE, partial [Candidatus Zixiibacteriota bacterium]